MFTKFRAYLLFLLLFAVLSCDGVCSNSALAGEAFSRKIEVFRVELGSYHSPLHPNERYIAGSRLNTALLDILLEEESLTAKPEEILGEGGSFELKFGDWVYGGEKQYRLVILNSYEINMGAMTTVFCQKRTGAKAIMAEKIHTLTQTPNAGFLVYAEIINCGNELFLPIVEVHHGPEDKYVRIYTLKLENDKWQAYMRPLNISAGSLWTIRGGKTGFSIGHPSMGWNSENDYEVKGSHGDIEIKITDKAKQNLDSIRVSLEDGRWVVRQ